MATTPAWSERPVSPPQPVALDVSSPVDQTDQALLRACRRGDTAAWDTLVERYERLVFSVALRVGLEREDAADVTQEAFVALLDSLDSLKEEAALASWLMTVARRTAWRIQKRNGRWTRQQSMDGATPVDPVSDWTSLIALHEAVSRLDEPCRTLISQLYLDAEQPSYAEIAERMGRSIGGIGPLRGRCLSHLRTILGNDFR